MKKYLLAAAVSVVSTGAFAICQYPLDATAAQYAAASVTPFPYISYQSAEYVAQSTIDATGNLNVVNYMALSAAGYDAAVQSLSTGFPGGDVTLPSSGIVAFEMAVDHFPTSANTGANLYLGVGMTTSNGLIPADPSQNAFSANIEFIDTGWSSGPFTIVLAGSNTSSQVTWAAGDQRPLALPLPSTYRVGVYINMNTRQVGYTLNGVDRGYLTNQQGGSFTIPAGVQHVMLGITGIMQVEDNNPLAGSPVGGTLITDKSQFTQPFPAGTTDICSAGGDVQGLQLPNGKPFPGKANPPGLQKFQNLLLPAKPLGQLLKTNR